MNPRQETVFVYGWCVVFRPDLAIEHWMVDDQDDDHQMPFAAPAFYPDYQTALDRAMFLRSKDFDARVMPLVFMPDDLSPTA